MSRTGTAVVFTLEEIQGDHSKYIMVAEGRAELSYRTSNARIHTAFYRSGGFELLENGEVTVVGKYIIHERHDPESGERYRITQFDSAEEARAALDTLKRILEGDL